MSRTAAITGDQLKNALTTTCAERAIVHGNRELIHLYEEKVKKVIERIWH